MKKSILITLSLIILFGCGERKIPKDNTQFTIAYKLVDGSWDTGYWDLPSDARVSIEGADGVYSMRYSSALEHERSVKLKGACIDHRILRKQFMFDTITKPVEFK